VNSKISIALALLATMLAGCTPFPRAIDDEIQITEVHMINVRDGWGWSGGMPGQRLLLHTGDGGKNWRDVGPSRFPFTEEGACFRDARTAWVPLFNKTNVTGGLLQTTDGGMSWYLQTGTNAPIFNEASSCLFYSPAYGVGNTSDGGLGSSFVTFFETHDAGKTWSEIPLTPRQPGSAESPHTFHLSNAGGDRMAFYPPSTAIIAYGDAADEQPKGAVRLSVTTDLGKTWHDLKLPLPEVYHDFLCVPLQPVFFDEQNSVLAVRVFGTKPDGAYENGDLLFYRSHDGGANWSFQPGTISVRQPLYGNAFSFVSSQDFIVANGSNIHVSRDGAKTWQIISPNVWFGGNSHRDIVQMDFVDANHGWLVLSDHNQFHLYGNFILYRTTDGGKIWTELYTRILY
jgi:photosystem II stability/assembly factor-like uncharacterized protein